MHLHLVRHGGHCCGIKTIHGFTAHPNLKEPAITQETLNTLLKAGKPLYFTNITAAKTNKPLRPAETAKERLYAFVDFMKKHQRNGMIEAVLAPIYIPDVDDNGEVNYGKSPLRQHEVWGPILEELGFVKTCEWVNSNSSNTCFHYALRYGPLNQPEPEPKAKAPQAPLRRQAS